MADETTPPPVPTTPAKAARGGVPSPVPDGSDLGTFTRGFVSGARPVMMANAKLVGTGAALLLISIVQHYNGKADTKAVEDKVVEVSKDATETTKRAYKGLAQPTNKLQARVQSCEERLTAVEATQKAQSALIVAREHDFVVEGRPAAARPRRVDKGLVDAVRANAAKNSKELEARKAKPLPALKPIPLELPAALPAVTQAGAGGATSASQAPPPQVRDAGHSP